MASSRSARGALVATSLGFAVVQLDVSVVNVALRPIGSGLGGGTSTLQWVVNAYTLSFAALILTAGALGDRLGARRMFLTGFIAFTAASAACGAAPTLAALIAARAVQGAGAALLVPCSLSLLTHAYDDETERGRAVGLWAAGASVALSGGPLVGGLLTAGLGWRAIFFINAPVGAVGVWLTLRHTTETTRSADRPLDPPGQLTGIVALGALAAATIEGGRLGFASPVILAGYLVAALAAAAFVAVEARRDRPMLPLGFFRRPAFAGATVIGLAINVAFYGLVFVLSLYFEQVHHDSALSTGLAFAPMTAAVLPANVLAPRLGARCGPRSVLLAGAGALLVGALALEVADATSGYGWLVAELMAMGVGVGLIVPVMTSGLLGSVPRDRAGVASGTLNTARQTGSVIGVALFGSLSSGHVVTGLHTCLLIAAGLAMVAGLAALTVGARQPSATAG